MFAKLLDSVLKEMKDEPIVSITKVVDCDSEFCVGEEFDFSLHSL